MCARYTRIGREPSEKREANECYKIVMDSFIPFWDSRNRVMNKAMENMTWYRFGRDWNFILFALCLLCMYADLHQFDLAIDCKDEKRKMQKSNEKKKKRNRTAHRQSATHAPFLHRIFNSRRKLITLCTTQRYELRILFFPFFASHLAMTRGFSSYIQTQPHSFALPLFRPFFCCFSSIKFRSNYKKKFRVKHRIKRTCEKEQNQR